MTKKSGNASLRASIPKWLARLTFFAEDCDIKGLKLSASAIIILAKTPHYGTIGTLDLNLKRLSVIAVSCVQQILAEEEITESNLIELHTIAAEAQFLSQD